MTRRPLVLQLYNTKEFTAYRGKLDQNGQATASINVPPALKNIPNATLWHAFIVIDKTGNPVLGSNPLPVDLKN